MGPKVEPFAEMECAHKKAPVCEKPGLHDLLSCYVRLAGCDGDDNSSSHAEDRSADQKSASAREESTATR